MPNPVDRVRRGPRGLLAFGFIAMTAVGASASFGAIPPALVSYQGVLRDSMGKPLDGTFDMTFHFYDSLTGGYELLVDAHTGSGGVVVTGGLFNVLLGGGVVSDGSGPGVWTSLDPVFAYYDTIYLEVQVGSETLAPRTRLVSAPYSLNASNLAGNPGSYYLDISIGDQTKYGVLSGQSGLRGYNSYGEGEYGFGIWGSGRMGGGRFRSSVSASYADLGTNVAGISAYTDTSYGGHFTDWRGQDVTAANALMGFGLSATGWVMGGNFATRGGSGVGYVASGDLGFDGAGLQAGAHFMKPNTNAQAFLGAGDIYGYQDGVYGISNGAGESPGFFWNQQTGNYAYAGYGTYKIEGNGSVAFVQNDPSDASRVIQYTAPEGDEAAVYTRGTARLENGVARVALGETFQWVAAPDTGLTVQLTPHGAAVPLAVESVTTSTLVVRGPDAGPRDLVFDYTVWGLRIGFEDHPVVQPKKQEAFIPSMKEDDATFVAHPELKSFNARARFARMEAAVDPERASRRDDTNAAASLKAAIHVYDRDVDLPRMLAANPMAADAIQARNAVAGARTIANASAVAPPSGSIEAVRGPGGAAAPSARPVAPTAPDGAVPRPDAGTPQGTPFPGTTTVAVKGNVRAGDVLTVTDAPGGQVTLSSQRLDRGVVGIAGGASDAVWSERAPLVMAGVMALCNVDASYGEIAVGDLLAASPTPGHAMRAGETPPPGTVIAKALEPLDAGTGTIRVLVLGR